jgi:hypothetical protein
MYLEHALVGTTTNMLGESASTSKIPPLTGIDEKIADCSISIGHSTSFLFYVVLFYTYSSSLELVIMTNVCVRGEKCF